MSQNGIRYHVGVGGWEHDVLDRCLYPSAGLSPAAKLEIYARYFSTTEIRPTFWDDSLGADDARDVRAVPNEAVWTSVIRAPGLVDLDLRVSDTSAGVERLREVRPEVLLEVRMGTLDSGVDKKSGRVNVDITE